MTIAQQACVTLRGGTQLLAEGNDPHALREAEELSRKHASDSIVESLSPSLTRHQPSDNQDFSIFTLVHQTELRWSSGDAGLMMPRSRDDVIIPMMFGLERISTTTEDFRTRVLGGRHHRPGRRCGEKPQPTARRWKNACFASGDGQRVHEAGAERPRFRSMGRRAGLDGRTVGAMAAAELHAASSTRSRAHCRF